MAPTNGMNRNITYASWQVRLVTSERYVRNAVNRREYVHIMRLALLQTNAAYANDENARGTVNAVIVRQHSNGG